MQTQRKEKLFGGEVGVVVFENDMADAVIDNAFIEGLFLQKIFNYYDKNSELNRLNSKRELKVSDELLLVIKKALELSELTHGDYDVTLGKSILEKKKNGKSVRSDCSFKDVKIEGNFVRLMNDSVSIDLGSIAKGFIADRMNDVLKNSGVLSSAIDARGDIVVLGSHVVSVQDPRSDKIFCSVILKDEAIATSGDYKQFHETFNKSHILNQKSAISVSVIANDLMTADMVATALFVSKNPEIIVDKYGVSAMIISDKGLVKYYGGFENKLWNEKH